MKNTLMIFLIHILCIYSLQTFAALKNTELGTQQAGTITAINLADRTIQIGQQQYMLSDELQVYTLDHAMIIQTVLMPGQKIEFWAHDQDQPISDKLPSKVVTKIHLLFDLKKTFNKPFAK